MKELKKLLETARKAIIDYQNKLKQQEALLTEQQKKYQDISDEFEKCKIDLVQLPKFHSL